MVMHRGRTKLRRQNTAIFQEHLPFQYVPRHLHPMNAIIGFTARWHGAY